jgi:hypothetical protein
VTGSKKIRLIKRTRKNQFRMIRDLDSLYYKIGKRNKIILGTLLYQFTLFLIISKLAKK